MAFNLQSVIGSNLGELAQKLITIWKVPADKVFEHQAEVENATLDLQAKTLDAIAKESQGQLEVNKVEAANSSIFVAGWRPFIGWICGSGLAVQFIVRPFVLWGCSLWNVTVQFPVLDSNLMLDLVLGMLGMGAMRSWDKYKGVATIGVGKDKES